MPIPGASLSSYGKQECRDVALLRSSQPRLLAPGKMDLVMAWSFPAWFDFCCAGANAAAAVWQGELFQVTPGAPPRSTMHKT